MAFLVHTEMFATVSSIMLKFHCISSILSILPINQYHHIAVTVRIILLFSPPIQVLSTNFVETFTPRGSQSWSLSSTRPWSISAPSSCSKMTSRSPRWTLGRCSQQPPSWWCQLLPLPLRGELGSCIAPGSLRS